MAFVPVIVVIIFVIAFTPSSPKKRRRSGRRKSKGFIGSLMSENSGGVMCGPSGVGARGGKRKR